MTTTSNDHHKEQPSLIDALSKENKERNCSNPSSSSKGEDLITIDQKQVSSSTTTETSSMEDTDQARDTIANPNEGDNHKLILSARAEMDRVREENEKLKQTLSQMLKDYKSLQMHLHEVFQHEARKDGDVNVGPDPNVAQEDEELELVSLSLGRVSDKPKTTTDEKKANGITKLGIDTDMEYHEGLTLGLECSKFDLKKHSRLESNSRSHEGDEEETTDATPPPVSGLKTERNDDNDLLPQIPFKKARVSVRARCDAPTMNDGCQWRKYGQKIAKGNPCPRAYYRCTVSSSCPVRKHVQRCANDKSILITTYEGTHNHPLPASAKAMASTTSAAASMLKSPSTTSSQPGISGGSATTSYASLYGLNYNSRINQYPVYIPSTTISTYQSHPTITLDLTATPSNFLTAPRFTSTSLNFSSPASSSSLESNYRNHMHGFSYLGRPMLKDAFYQTSSYMHSKDSMQQSSAETIAAATKALTSNPTFRSALAASITSFVGNVGAGGQM